MKIIPISRGLHVKVDDEDFEHLSKWRWSANPSGKKFYAIRRPSSSGGSAVFMHRILVGDPLGMTVDHIDCDTLNNQKSNLRICTFAQNLQNRSISDKNKSGFKGVFFAKHPHNRWRAVLQVGKKRYHLGQFLDPRMAALKYDEGAIKHFGEFAKTNKQLGLL